MSLMMYCVLSAHNQLDLDALKAVAPETSLNLVIEGPLAALVSPVERDYVRPSRRNIKAFQQVMEHLLEAGITVLPLRFGTLVQDEAHLRLGLLQPQATELQTWLDKMHNRYEVSLRVVWPSNLLFSQAREQLKQQNVDLQAEDMPTQLELGRAVASALADLHAETRQTLLDLLQPIAHDYRLEDPKDDLTSLQVAFLLSADIQADFEAAIHQGDDLYNGKLHFKLVSPLPVYSFVDIVLQIQPVNDVIA